MIALDTDVLSDYFVGRPDYVARIQAIPQSDVFVPIVVAEEIVRGRLDQIRRAEAGRAAYSLGQAYSFFASTLVGVGRLQILPYSPAADNFVQQWKSAKLRVGSRDLRIGGICLAHGVTLVTRNRRDFHLLPGLQLDVWP